MSKSEKLEDLLEGKPVVIVEDGQLAWENVQSANMTEFEFFMELRLNSVEQLGQVRLAIMETNGQISVYYYSDDEVKPGLCILPDMLIERFRTVPESGEYACVRCSHVVAMQPGIVNYAPAVQIRNGRRLAGPNASPDSHFVGFVLARRQIVLCDAGHISRVISFRYCGACH